MAKVKTKEAHRRPIMGHKPIKAKLMCEIRKGSGSSAYIKQDGCRIPLTDNSIQEIKKQSIRFGKTVLINTKGLSRSQISRVATDIQEGNPAKVFVREILNEYGDSPVSRIKNYQIIIEQGKNYVKEF